MARKLLGTIQVYVEDGTAGHASAVEGNVMERDNPEAPNRLIIRPDADERALAQIVGTGNDRANKLPASKFASILAHELGHAVARLLRTRVSESEAREFISHHMLGALGLYLPQPTTETKVAAESEAWDFGAKMWPVDDDVREGALDTYRKAARR